MEVVHLNQKQLAARWSISEATLERWRSEGIGPKSLKLGGRVLYRQADIEAYEESCLATSNSRRKIILLCNNDLERSGKKFFVNFRR